MLIYQRVDVFAGHVHFEDVTTTLTHFFFGMSNEKCAVLDFMIPI